MEKKLKDLFEIKKGKREEEQEVQDNESVRYIQIEDLRTDENIKFCKVNSKSTFVNPDNIIIAWDGANAGTIGYGLKGVIGSTLARLEPREEGFSTDYVGKYLQSKLRYLKDNCTGATIPHINRKVLENLLVPLPLLKTQKKIVEILDKAQELVDLRKKQIKMLDELIKSIFYDMFGDPVINPKGWDVEKLGNIGKLQRGKSKHRPRNAPELLGGKYPLIQTGDIANAGYYLKTYNQTYSELGLKQSKMWKKGTLCITIAANIAKTSILDFDACFPDSVVAFLPYGEANNMYVQIWFGFLQNIIEASAPESAQKNINLKILRNLDIPVPPIKLQNQFAEKVQKIEEQKELMQESLTEMQNNFNSLMQRAFKGELFN